MVTVNKNTSVPTEETPSLSVSCPKGLKQHFPTIRDRNQVLQEIVDNPGLQAIFDSWDAFAMEEFLDMCTGVRGVKLLYDSFFKEIMNPDTVPERLEELLSLILGKKVTILKVLPNDSARIAAENSLLVLDMVVELEDGSIANVEVQKIGYAFPGERTSCYSADLLLRQYKRVRSTKGKSFQYKDIKKVYTIVFLEKSTKEFHLHPDYYMHYGKTVFDTGLQINLLQEYIFFALDILKEKQHNKGIETDNRLEAWLTFLSTDDPERIAQLLDTYPSFRPLYEEVYDMCRNMEKMMEWFSKELIELDKNTVQYMIDEMQDTIDEQKGTIDKQKGLLESKDKQLETKDKQLESQTALLQDKDSLINNQKKKIDELAEEIALLKLRY